MIAVYYCKDSSPYTLLVIPITLGTEEELTSLFESGEYPYPTSEVIIIENEKYIDALTFIPRHSLF